MKNLFDLIEEADSYKINNYEKTESYWIRSGYVEFKYYKINKGELEEESIYKITFDALNKADFNKQKKCFVVTTTDEEQIDLFLYKLHPHY